MKTKLFITSILLTLTMTGPVYAASSKPTVAPPQSESSQINQLKDKIASQVSQLKLVEKRGIIGTIQSTTDNQITVQDTQGQIRYIDLDEITKYESTQGSTVSQTSMKKGAQVSILGIYNKDSQRILARFVSVAVVPTRFYGEITAIDKPNFQVTVTTADQKTEKVEIDTTSTVSSYSGGTSLGTYGFSKMSLGDRIDVIGYPDKKDATLILADRIIDYLNAPKSANITFATPSPAVTIAPTSKGSKSINPIK